MPRIESWGVNRDLGEALGSRGWRRCWRSFMRGPYGFPFQKASAKALKSLSHLEQFPESASHCGPNTSLLFLSTAFHEVSVYPKKELPFFILFTAGLCSFTAMLALLTHQFPELMGVFAKAVSICQERGLGQGAGKVMKSSVRDTGEGHVKVDVLVLILCSLTLNFQYHQSNQNAKV